MKLRCMPSWCSCLKMSMLNVRCCIFRISGVLWTDDNFQVSTNKLTFIDLELKLRDKITVFSRVQNGVSQLMADLFLSFLMSTFVWMEREKNKQLSRDMRFPTMSYV